MINNAIRRSRSPGFSNRQTGTSNQLQPADPDLNPIILFGSNYTQKNPF